ncbi:hypothetical protein [Bacillus alkalicellulosilyticus]|uniref:hypothetical protein n=1 Tax=Alkalihalobacterium alkalicellulosilyticum TaxID=1912214 RepID=UPI0009978E5E|nr:hypothetical protein [Bacillus alkalicellulosilyticus]
MKKIPYNGMLFIIIAMLLLFIHGSVIEYFEDNTISFQRLLYIFLTLVLLGVHLLNRKNKGHNQ